jgi:hypothetical protein
MKIISTVLNVASKVTEKCNASTITIKETTIIKTKKIREHQIEDISPSH